jgi:hypothetical protein
MTRLAIISPRSRRSPVTRAGEDRSRGRWPRASARRIQSGLRSRIKSGSSRASGQAGVAPARFGREQDQHLVDQVAEAFDGADALFGTGAALGRGRVSRCRSSSWVRTPASGVRSWWAALATKRCWASAASSRRFEELVEFGPPAGGSRPARRGGVEGATARCSMPCRLRRMSSTGSRAWRMPNQMVKPVAAAKKSSGRSRAKARSTRSWSRLRVVSAVTKTKGAPEIGAMDGDDADGVAAEVGVEAARSPWASSPSGARGAGRRHRPRSGRWGRGPGSRCRPPGRPAAPARRRQETRSAARRP